MKTADYIEALKPLAKKPSIYAVAQLLDMNEDTVRHYAKGRRAFDALAATKVAEILDIPAMQVIADAEAERETDEKRRDYWRELSRKLAGVTAMLVFAITPFQSGESWATPLPNRSKCDEKTFDNDAIIARQFEVEYKLYALLILAIACKSRAWSRYLRSLFAQDDLARVF